MGTLGARPEERVVTLASFSRLRDPSTAEVAFAVADEEQGRGIGTRLLEQLATRAADIGIRTFVAEVMAANRAMLRVFSDAGFEIGRELEGGTIEVRLSIQPTETFRERVEARDHVAVSASLRPFFSPASVAVIGASRRRGSIGGELFRNILDADFTGAVYPVNGSGEPVAGVRGLPLDGGDPGPGRPGRHLRPGGARPRRCRHGSRGRDQSTARDLVRLRRDGRGRTRAPGAAARRRPRTRRAAGRPELSRHLVVLHAAERHLRAPRATAGAHRVLVAKRRTRACPARAGRRAATRFLRLRLDREQGRRLVERSARMVGGRSGDRRRPPLSGVVRQPAQVRSPGSTRRPPQAHPRPQGRHDGRGRESRELAHRCARRLGRGRRRPLPPGGRAARGRRSRSSSTSRRCCRASLFPVAAGSP